MKEDYYEELDEENVYADGAREHLVEDGEMSPEEDAFMQGYEEAESPEKAEEDEEDLE